MKETRVTDGATLRHSRIMRMLQWILEVEGATIGDIRSMMLMNYGLKYRTTSDYVYECWQAGSLRLSQDGRYIVSARFKKYIK